MQPEVDLLGISIKTFGVVFALGFLACGLLIARRLRELSKPVDWAYELVFAALVGGVVGARGYFVIQNYSEVKHDLIGTIFSGSGLIWYGGAVGGAIAVIAWMRFRHAFELRMFDMTATALALGYAIGRIGCQVSGDGDYGIRSSLPWAMGYPHGTVPTPAGVRVQPTPIYETVAMCLLAYLLWWMRDRVRPGVVFALYMLLSGFERFLVEFIRRNKEVFVGLTAAQIESVVLMAVGAAWLLWMHRRGGLTLSGDRARGRPARGKSSAARDNPGMATQATQSASALEQAPALPRDSALDERGRLRIGGCDTIELARELGTPAYVVAEEDLRARARAFVRAGAQSGHEDFHVAFAAKAFPCSAVLSLFAQEGLWCDVASGGELHLALNAGFAPERIVLHGNAKTEADLRMALERRVGTIVVDNFDEIDRLARLADIERSGPQDVLIRVTPDVRGDTHDHISTGQADSKFGFGTGEAQEAIARIGQIAALRLTGLHAHIGSQLLELDPFRREVAELARLGDFPMWDLGGGLGVRYTADQPQPPSIDAYVGTLLVAASEHGMGPGSGRRLVIEPGRSLCANAGVTLYTVQSVRRNVSHWVAVDGGMSDNLRPMLYGARYEAHVADRLNGGSSYVLAGMHCESGDVIVREAMLDDPKPGDVIVVPATGAYGYAMASNYNGMPRPPVIFCRDGHARVVVRRETFDDLTARDVG